MSGRCWSSDIRKDLVKSVFWTRGVDVHCRSLLTREPCSRLRNCASCNPWPTILWWYRTGPPTWIPNTYENSLINRLIPVWALLTCCFMLVARNVATSLTRLAGANGLVRQSVEWGPLGLCNWPTIVERLTCRRITCTLNLRREMVFL